MCTWTALNVSHNNWSILAMNSSRAPHNARKPINFIYLSMLGCAKVLHYLYMKQKFIYKHEPIFLQFTVLCLSWSSKRGGHIYNFYSLEFAQLQYPRLHWFNYCWFLFIFFLGFELCSVFILPSRHTMWPKSSLGHESDYKKSLKKVSLVINFVSLLCWEHWVCSNLHS
jgi:hypothetical protein